MTITIRNKVGFEVSAINEMVKTNAKSLIKDYEDRYNNNVKNIVDNVVKTGKRIILMSGPSGSGKTTTSKKLALALKNKGIKAEVVSLDNFYKSSQDAPRLPNGEQDYESIRALETGLIAEKLNHITEYQYTKLPVFDFINGTRHDDAFVFDVGENGIAIVEGIHALNKEILDNLKRNTYLTVYISIHSNFCEDGRIVLPKRSARLIQRTVRDFHKRGSSTENTLKMWDKVCEGEDLYIRPNANNADIRFDTTLPYSPCVLKNEAITMFGSVDKESEFYEQSQNIVKSLQRFESMDVSLVPEDSVLREFSGGSVFE